MSKERLALVTGANRGIGLEICRQLAQKGIRVILTSRDAAKGEAARAGLKEDGLEVEFHGLDVSDPESIEILKNYVEEKFGWLDILVNNAGIFLDKFSADAPGIFEADPELITDTLQTNLYGPLRLCQAFVPMMKVQNYGRIVNLSSGLGQLEEMGGGYPAYRISKTALNALTRMVAHEVDGMNILVNSVCPGWVKTEMGGEGATRSVEHGAETPVWLATLEDGGPNGGFFRDKKRIAW